ncbi:MAG: M23 family metallopeptidase [Proteobacteria bacterium]|nr:M23 family metallopeptidase [Pseudomonadota bacterium]
MAEIRRHASVGRTRRGTARDRVRGLSNLYVARKRGPLPDLYVTDRAEARRGGFRWFFSTWLAAMVGAVAIAAVIFGSLEVGDVSRHLGAALRQATRPAPDRAKRHLANAVDGLPWTVPKSDRLHTTLDATSTRYIVQDSIRERRANREYLHKKPYARVVLRLASVSADPSVAVPPFNPLKLYSGQAPASEAAQSSDGAASPDGGEVTTRVVDLLGSSLPIEDGQELEASEVGEIVARSMTSEGDAAGIRPSFAPDGAEAAIRSAGGIVAPYTTVLAKSSSDTEEVSDEADGERVRVKMSRGETLTKLLTRMGAETWLAREMVDAARGLVQESAIGAGYEVELTLIPSLTGSGKTEPSRYTVFGPGGEHRVTVERNAAGEFTASATPTHHQTASKGDGSEPLSLYSSLYYGAIAQGIPPETIQAILRTHAYEADFRRRPRGSDTIELFFDLKDEDRGADSTLGELLLSSMTIGGVTTRFYRYKDGDGSVDFYDENGNNSRRFLLRKPVRSDDVRLTSGFGYRFHPLLNAKKFHSGLDWAAPVGTPILASGNGTIEDAGYKGGYGNYVRIRHANGYQTAYGHMKSFASGIAPGASVRQGQVIGWIGLSGLSTGAHLHFEVLVNKRPVDPLSIQVPREKHLAAKQLANFQRERVRIDELMRQPPVRVSSIEPKH